ncbi:MAG: FtsW/RodA/SpoVE family cell cycle protein [Bilifractor sp.]
MPLPGRRTADKVQKTGNQKISSISAQGDKSHTRRNAGSKVRARRKEPGYFDYSLLAVIIILICFGLVMLYSASAYEAKNDPLINNDMYYFNRQAFFSAVSIVVALVVSRINYHFWIRLAPAIYVLSMILMAMVRFTPFGVTVNGARRWLKIGIQFQPAEIAKIAIIVFMPYMIMLMGRNLNSPKAVFWLLVFGGAQAVGAYIFTDNLSTAIIIAGIVIGIIFLAHPKTRPFIVIALIAAAFIIVALVLLNQYVSTSTSFRLRRILAWLHPEDNLSSESYQVLQGLYAIGSGGIFGKGLGNSVQKLSIIPEAQNDMIFAIICEELGLFGALLLMLLFGYMLYRLFVIAQNAPDLYGTLIVSGIFIHISLQVILNIAVVLNVIPTTGVTLPFVSYGGTSVLFIMLEMGIALNVARSIRNNETEDVRRFQREFPDAGSSAVK